MSSASRSGLVRVGGGVGQPALPQGDDRAQAQGLEEHRDRAAIAGHEDRAVEVAPRAAPVADEDGAAAGLLHLLEDLQVVRERERLLDGRRAGSGVAGDQLADAVHEPAGEQLRVAARLGVELGEHAVDRVRLAAHRGGHARTHQQPEPGGAVGRQQRARCVGQQQVGVRRAPDGHRHHAAHPRRGAARHRVAQVGLGTIEQRHGMAEAPGQRRGDGGRHQALGAALRIGIELGGALQRAGGGGVPAAARGVVGSEGQRLGRLVVGGGGGGGTVPRAPVDVGAVVEHGGERLVRRAPLGEARGAVDRRAHQRMAEAQPRRHRRSAGRRARRRRGHRARSRDARRPAAASRRRRCRRLPPARAGAARRRRAARRGP